MSVAFYHIGTRIHRPNGRSGGQRDRRKAKNKEDDRYDFFHLIGSKVRPNYKVHYDSKFLMSVPLFHLFHSCSTHRWNKINAAMIRLTAAFWPCSTGFEKNVRQCKTKLVILANKDITTILISCSRRSCVEHPRYKLRDPQFQLLTSVLRSFISIQTNKGFSLPLSAINCLEFYLCNTCRIFAAYSFEE